MGAKCEPIKINRPILLGSGLSLASLPVHSMVSHAVSVQIAAMILVLVAGTYVGFAIQDGRAKPLVTEGLIALLFIGAAFTGLWATQWAVPAAYVLHGCWDVAHRNHVDTVMPTWYIPFCAVFDWVFAVGLLVTWLVR